MADINSKALYVANESYWWSDPGSPQGDMKIIKGQSRLRGSDPAVQANPQYWDLAQDNLTRDLEEATANPGEKRGADVPPPAAVSAEAKGKGAGASK